MFRFLLLILVLIASYILWDQRPVKHGVGVVAPDEPAMQRAARNMEIEFQHYVLKPHWQVKGMVRVLSKKDYWFEEKNHISPTDMIWGWAAMSDERVLSQVQLPIKNREFQLEVISPPITLNEIREQIMFVHAIPSNEEVKNEMSRIRKGHIISFKGYIVDVQDQSDWHWTSSISLNTNRLDTSLILWIEEIRIL